MTYVPIDVSAEAIYSNVVVTACSSSCEAKESRDGEQRPAWMTRLRAHPIIGTFEEAVP